jgi:class 3 adenylate cyclase/predicted ATPase
MVESTPSAGAERRQITVLFCDLVDSVGLSERLELEDLQNVLVVYRQVASETIERCGGHLARFVGDGILAYFGYPVALEDAARRAVRAALQMIEPIRHIRVPSPSGEALSVRIGIDTGLAIVGDIGSGAAFEQGGAIGETPNVAARLQGLAAPNTVLVGPQTWRLVAPYFECRALGPQRLKGLRRDIEVCEVLRERVVVVHRWLAPQLIGREPELMLLDDRWQSAAAGNGQAVLISGQPGIGKSRLLEAFAAGLGEAAPVLTLECSPFAQYSPWSPVVSLARRLLGLDGTADDMERRARVAAAAERFGFDAAALPLARSLLSLAESVEASGPDASPSGDRLRLREALLDALAVAAAERPLILAIEDVQWIDASTRELVDGLLARLDDLPVLLLLTVRSNAAAGWSSARELTHIVLASLRPSQVAQMIEDIGEGRRFAAGIVEELARKSNGIPLFVEELTRAMIEAPAEPSSRTASAVPATLRDSLLARLEGLPSARRVAQVAACIGLSFPYTLLHAVSPIPEPALRLELTHLLESGLLQQRGTFPDANLSFRHALLRDVAYDTLLTGARREQHLQLAAAILRLSPGVAESNPEIVAGHLAAGGDVRGAVAFWRRAAQSVGERGGFNEAIGHLSAALACIERARQEDDYSRLELDVLLALGTRLFHARGNAAREAYDAFARARELCERIEEPHALFAATRGLAAYHLVRGEMDAALRLGRELRELARRLGEPAYDMLAARVLGLTLFLCGELGEAASELDAAIALRRDGHVPLESEFFSGEAGEVGLCNRAWLRWYAGEPAAAQRQIEEALAYRDELSQPHSRAFALGYAACLHQCMGDVPRADAAADETLRLADRHELAYWRAWGAMLRGWAVAGRGDSAGGLEMLRDGLDAYRATGAGQMCSYFLCLVAEAQAQGGDAEGALATLAQALRDAESTGVRLFVPEILRQTARLGADSAGAEATMSLLREGIATARAQGALTSERRCLETAAALLPAEMVAALGSTPE